MPAQETSSSPPTSPWPRDASATARVIGTTGRPFTEDNVGDALATRDILSELRGAGTYTSGPPPFEKRDRSRFLPALDTAIQAIRQERLS